MAFEGIVSDFKLKLDDYIEGTILNPNISRIQVNYDGIKIAIIPVLSGKFTCQLPSLESPSDAIIDLVNPDNGWFFARFPITNRQPLTNTLGLKAHSVLKYKHNSLTICPWINFNGVNITLGGAHLPPMGDPDRVKISVDPGVVYTFKYPLPRQDYKEQFWYWPNAYYSAFSLEINLPASTCYPHTIALIDRDNPDEKYYIRFPNDLTSFVGFPRDLEQLGRVQNKDITSVTMTGYQEFRKFESLLMLNGISPHDKFTLLDWGCGHGRLTRHFIKHLPNAEIWGADIDKNNIEWAQNNIKAGQFISLPLTPPSTLPSNKFDVIIGLSVMTHLTAEMQDLWLKDLARSIKPGGLMLMTFGGETVAAYTSKFRSPQWWQNWIITGFDDSQKDPALDKVIDDKSYYRLTIQSKTDVRKRWSREFNIINIVQDVFGNLDVAIMRKK